MAILASNIVQWQNPNDPSVVKHKLYYCIEANSLNYDSPFVEIDMPICEYDLNQLPVSASGELYRLALTAVDSVNNESDMSTEKVIPLDSVPPSPPVWI